MSWKQGVNRYLNKLGYQLKKAQVRYPRKYLWIREKGIRGILDIGAHTGEWSLEIARHFPEVPIYAFEPLEDCFQALESKKSQLPQLQAYHIALGDTSGENIIYRSSNPSSSSLLKMGDLHKKAAPKSSGSTEEKIITNTLDQIAAEYQIDGPLFAKIDVQGFEMQVLRGGLKTLEKTAVLLCETSFQPLYEGQHLFEDVRMFLKSVGFDYAGEQESILNPVDGSILQGNSFFINRRLNPLST